MTSGYCPICKLWKNNIGRHHILKKIVFPEHIHNQKNIKKICRDCHDRINIVLQEKECEILRQHPQIYKETFNEFLYKNTPQRR